MKIVIVGNWHWPQYEKAFSVALTELGHEVQPFITSNSFKGIVGKQQEAVPIPGPAMLILNHALLKFVKQEQPDLLLAWSCTHLFPSTINAINKLGISTASYNNDDPFRSDKLRNLPWHQRQLWFWYLRTLKYFQHNFFYRQVNIHEAKLRGAQNASVLMPYFIPWRDRPVDLTEDEKQKYSCDVVFVGHFEADGRVNHIRALVNSGLSVKLFGGSYWSEQTLGELYPYFSPVIPAAGESYAKSLCGAKICLAFLSKLNRDTYTRRCFEIPAHGRVMLAERTDDLLKMFDEDKEACFFSSSEELVAKAKWLVQNPDIAEKIASAGLKRVWADGHDVKSRAAEFISVI